MLFTTIFIDNEKQGEGFWSAGIYVLKDFKPLRIGFVLVIHFPLQISITLESFVRNFSEDSKEQIDKEIKQMLILKGLVDKVEVHKHDFNL